MGDNDKVDELETSLSTFRFGGGLLFRSIAAG